MNAGKTDLKDLSKPNAHIWFQTRVIRVYPRLIISWLFRANHLGI